MDNIISAIRQKGSLFGINGTMENIFLYAVLSNMVFLLTWPPKCGKCFYSVSMSWCWMCCRIANYRKRSFLILQMYTQSLLCMWKQMSGLQISSWMEDESFKEILSHSSSSSLPLIQTSNYTSPWTYVDSVWGCKTTSTRFLKVNIAEMIKMMELKWQPTCETAWGLLQPANNITSTPSAS